MLPWRASRRYGFSNTPRDFFRPHSAEAEPCIAHLIAVLMQASTSLATLLQADMTEGEKVRSSDLAEYYGRTLAAATLESGG
jgi:hypothetical protein